MRSDAICGRLCEIAPSRNIRRPVGINWGLAVMFCIVVVVVVVGGTQSILLAMLTMKKELHGFLFVWMDAVLFLKLRCSAWWPFGLPELYY